MGPRVIHQSFQRVDSILYLYPSLNADDSPSSLLRRACALTLLLCICITGVSIVSYTLSRLWKEETWAERGASTTNLRNDPDNGKQKSHDAPVSRPVPANDPAKCDDGDGLDVSDYGTTHCAGLVDDVELRYVDHTCTEPALYRHWSAFDIGCVHRSTIRTHHKNQHPSIQRDCAEDGEAVGPRNDV